MAHSSARFLRDFLRDILWSINFQPMQSFSFSIMWTLEGVVDAQKLVKPKTALRWHHQKCGTQNIKSYILLDAEFFHLSLVQTLSKSTDKKSFAGHLIRRGGPKYHNLLTLDPFCFRNQLNHRPYVNQCLFSHTFLEINKAKRIPTNRHNSTPSWKF